MGFPSSCPCRGPFRSKLPTTPLLGIVVRADGYTCKLRVMFYAHPSTNVTASSVPARNVVTNFPSVS